MKIIAKNKRANFDYELKDTYVAGISLLGSEVKSIKDGNVALNGAFVILKKGNAYLINMNISQHSSYDIAHEPERSRQLLLNKRELRKIKQEVQLQRMTIVPKILFVTHKGLIKIEIALGKGKKKIDKRESAKEKDIKRNIRNVDYN